MRETSPTNQELSLYRWTSNLNQIIELLNTVERLSKGSSNSRAYNFSTHEFIILVTL